MTKTSIVCTNFTKLRANLQYPFFCCVLLACHEGRGRSPSVSEISEKTDLPTFPNIANNQIKQQCKQNLLTPRSSWVTDREPGGYDLFMAPYPSVAHLSWGLRDTTDGERLGTGTQRNRRSSSKLETKKVQPEVR